MSTFLHYLMKFSVRDFFVSLCLDFGVAREEMETQYHYKTRSVEHGKKGEKKVSPSMFADFAAKVQSRNLRRWKREERVFP